MFHRLREPFGKAGLIVAIVALVASLAGGTYAAENSGDNATASAKRGGNVNKLIKRESQKFSKRFSQRFSRRFAVAGPAGPVGAAGAKGAVGAAGAAGVGTQGDPGDNGKSVTGDPIAADDVCGTETGVKYTLDGTDTNVCNGAPWTAGGTLPEGETLTGAWMINTITGQSPQAALSFALPLAAPLDEEHVHYVTEPTAECPGDATAPAAEPGELCVFEGGIFDNGGTLSPLITDPTTSLAGPSVGAATSGAILFTSPESAFEGAA